MRKSRRSALPLLFLSLLVAGALSGGEFRILPQVVGTNAVLTFDCATDAYYQIMAAGSLESGKWAITHMGLGSLSQASWTGSFPQAIQFFHVCAVPQSMPRDGDDDGLDDVFELSRPGFDPLDPSDASRDPDQDGLSNLQEYLHGTDPELADTDGDWVSDGYEYEQGTDPLNSESAPTLRMEVDDGNFYANSTNLEIRIRGLVADELILAETLTLEESVTNRCSERVHYNLNGEENGDRSVCVVAVRGGTTTGFMATASIILDTAPPCLKVTNPSSGWITADRWVRIEGLATDAVSSVCVKLNGSWADGVSSGRFWKSRFTLSQGTNRIDITAADNAGNCVTQSLVIVQDLSLDTNAPVMSLDLPSDFTVQGGATNWKYGITTFGNETNLAFRGSIDDETAVVKVRVESPLGTHGPFNAGVGGGTQVWGEVTLFEGSNQLVATAADAAGNVSTCLWTVIRNTNFMFRIARPLPWEVVNGHSVYVTGVASPEFSNAAVSVNGQAASVVAGSNVTFRTDSAVPLGDGVTKLSACAVLNGQSYYADPAVTTYEITRWMSKELNTYKYKNFNVADQESAEEYGDIWDEHQKKWDKDSQVLEDSNQWYCWEQFWDGSQQGYPSFEFGSYPATNCPASWAKFGLKREWFADDLHIGSRNGSYDGELRFIKDAMIEEKELVFLQFPGLDYGRTPGEPIDPTKIQFKGNPGFWYNSNVTFLVEIQRDVEYAISANDFDWPAYAYHYSGNGYSYDYSGRWLAFGSMGMNALRVGMTAYRPTTEGPAYNNPFQRREIPEAQEETPGAGIRVNGDDDNNNSAADRNDTTVNNENDLIEVVLDASPPASSEFKYVLKRSSGNLKVWTTQNKTTALLDANSETNLTFSATPTTVWVENPSGGAADLELQAKTDSGTVFCSDKVHFYPFTSIVIALGGEDQVPTDPANANHGVFHLAIDLYEQGYDVHMYDEDNVADNGAGVTYDEVANAVQHRNVNQVAIYGYSHGGGSTFLLANLLNNNRGAIGTFTIPFTAYTDAVEDEFMGDMNQEHRRPPSSAFHVNYYQEGSLVDGWLDGGPIDNPPGADFELDVDNPTPTETHQTVDDDAAVLNGIETRLTPRVAR